MHVWDTWGLFSGSYIYKADAFNLCVSTLGCEQLCFAGAKFKRGVCVVCICVCKWVEWGTGANPDDAKSGGAQGPQPMRMRRTCGFKN